MVTKTLHLLSGIVLGKDLITLTFVELREFDRLTVTIAVRGDREIGEIQEEETLTESHCH